jgi:FkbM family methyltransferase
MTEAALPPPEVYGDTVLWELPVQNAVRDEIRPGDVVLDVGANVGGLSIAFSRCVGQSGAVFAFECNPKMIRWIQRDLAANGVTNVELIERAAWSRSNQRMTLHLHDTYYSSASSLFWDWGQGELEVETISIDDLCSARNLAPRLIKLDVEGAEDAVLEGARATLERHRPIIVTEVHPRGGPAQVKRLIQSYDLFDVNSYEPFGRADLHPYIPCNVVAFPKEWNIRHECEPWRTFAAADVAAPAGRILIECAVATQGEGVGELKIWMDDTLASLAHAPFDRLPHHSVSTAVFLLDEPQRFRVECRPIAGTGTCHVEAVRVRQIRRLRSPT